MTSDPLALWREERHLTDNTAWEICNLSTSGYNIAYIQRILGVTSRPLPQTLSGASVTEWRVYAIYNNMFTVLWTRVVDVMGETHWASAQLHVNMYETLARARREFTDIPEAILQQASILETMEFTSNICSAVGDPPPRMFPSPSHPPRPQARFVRATPPTVSSRANRMFGSGRTEFTACSGARWRVFARTSISARSTISIGESGGIFIRTDLPTHVIVEARYGRSTDAEMHDLSVLGDHLDYLFQGEAYQEVAIFGGVPFADTTFPCRYFTTSILDTRYPVTHTSVVIRKTHSFVDGRHSLYTYEITPNSVVQVNDTVSITDDDIHSAFEDSSNDGEAEDYEEDV